MTAAAGDDALVQALAGSAFFGGLEPHVLARLLRDAERRSLRGGALLFRAGEAARSMGYVVAGCLGVFAGPEATGPLLGRIGAGETVGEMGLLSGRPRSATVVALRDTELLEFSRASFERLIDTHPRALLELARILIRRLERRETAERDAVPRTLALLPLEGAAAGEAAERLAAALAPLGPTHVVAPEERGRPAGWFSELERRHRFVLYPGDPAAPGWDLFCARQADLELWVGGLEAGRWRVPVPPAPWRPRWLALLAERIPRGLGARGRALGAERVLPVAAAGGWARLARLVARRGVGIVFSGGGARGFAHVGMLQALAEAGIEADAVGGSSIGAVVAAGVACGWSLAEITARFRDAFVRSNPLGDYTVPFVALTRGRRVSERLRAHFGGVDVEDLDLPFYAVATRLGAGSARVFAEGPLWLALRASTAIPGLLPPVFHEGEVLVDGGVADNLPVAPMRALAPGRIVGLEVAGDFRLRSSWDETELPPLPRMVLEWFRGRRRHDIARILLRAGMVNSEAALAAARERLDLHLRPPLDGLDLLAWRDLDRIVEAGYRYASERLRGMRLSLAS
ncbi:MAG: patatin-like phospholipase family protein [Xanthomonadales bacterium]|nr:patatin-like phospholipase family protein [Xanthomonadales bacterium]